MTTFNPQHSDAAPDYTDDGHDQRFFQTGEDETDSQGRDFDEQDFGHVNPSEIVYPNEWAIAPGSTITTPVEAEHPDLFYQGNKPAKRVLSAEWSPRIVMVGANGQPVLLAGPNPRRSSITIYTDAANTAGIVLSDSRGLSAVGVGAGTPAIILGPNSQPLILRHTGEIWACSTANGTVYSIEENYA